MIRYLLDENVARQVDSAVRTWHRKAAGPPVDVVRVGEPPDLPAGSTDPDMLRWAERHGRVVVTDDVNTMPGHLAAHLAAGGVSPGVFRVRPRTRPTVLVAELAMISFAGDPGDYADAVTFVPL